MNTSAQKLKKLRALMQQAHLDFYLVPNADPHQTEYTPEYWRRRAYISEFTGSSGDVLVGLDQAYLWTDGRYTLQAKLELDPQAFTLLGYTQGQAATLINFLSAHAPNKRVGVDPSTMSAQVYEKLATQLQAIGGELVPLTQNLVDQIWDARPHFKSAPAMVYPLEFAGEGVQNKLAALRAFMQTEALDYIALNELSDIAWLFNIRGQDTEDSPFVFSYALISPTQARLYVDAAAVTLALKDYCQQHQLHLAAYENFYQDLAQLKKVTVGLDSSANALMQHALLAARVKFVELPLQLAKACKNASELQGMMRAHIEDACALVRFFAWLEQHWQGQTEVSVAAKLLELRRESSLFFKPSFATIAGFKDHGAIVHYHAEAESAYALDNSGLFLLDSGGQYWGGTTDVTRTLHLGRPTAFEQECYTLVLKGHLALRHTPFPQGTRGEQLDALARQYLWQQGYNYAHGTGHGVGAFLNVHEGPHRISSGPATTPLMLNMITSNEPGLYLEGQFGIRIENVCYVKLAQVSSQGHQTFYILEDLTLVPYCRKLIDVARLSQDEISWINQYHEKIYQTLLPLLPDDIASTWLFEATRPL